MKRQLNPGRFAVNLGLAAVLLARAAAAQGIDANQ
jgi:hypothetical protein